MPDKIPPEHFVDFVKSNIDNDKLSDKEFRVVIQAALESVDRIKVIDERPYPTASGDEHLTVVLREVGGPQPYVTHIRNNRHTDGYFYGHYFDTETEAREDFIKRE